MNVGAAGQPNQTHFTEPSPSQAPSRPGGRPAWMMALLAVTLAMVFFFPNLDRWLLHDYAIAANMPETSRAAFEAGRLEDPWHTPRSTTHGLVTWRLIPVVPLHFLQAPHWVLIGLAWAGVPALVFYCARRGAPRAGTMPRLAVALAAATSASALVSIGWLTYMDAWWVLGLCVVVLSPSDFSRLTAALVVSFMDERFIIGLPLALLARHLFPPRENEAPESLAKLLLPAWGVAPYLLLRAAAWHWDLNQDAARFISERKLSDWFHPEALAAGLWQGCRALWLPALIALLWRARGRPMNAGLAAAAAGTYLAGCSVADDFSRNTGMLLPVVIVVAIDAINRRDVLVIRATMLAAVANLLLPAWHQIGVNRHPVFPVWRVLSGLDEHRRNIVVNGGVLFAEMHIEKGNPQGAIRYLNEAHAMSPKDERVIRLGKIAAERSGLRGLAAYYAAQSRTANP